MKAGIAIAALMFMATPAFAAMTVTSSNFTDGATLAQAQLYGQCGGSNISPALSWSGAPAATKSFVITLFDPDSDQRGWWHWIVFNIPASTTAVPQGGPVPADAVQATNDFGNKGYSGACPPPGSGVHHYQFTVWAMDVNGLPFDETADGGVFKDFLQQHGLDHATITPVLQH
jgi:Raf kinase inhibitor-like YbhB/YbcL family protein